MSPRVAVVTVVHGRHEHLRGQRWGLARQVLAPDEHVVVAMGDADVAGVAAAEPGPPVRVVDVPLVDGRLPLAAARNAGVDAAFREDADVVVLLDVDCVPSPGLVAEYVDVLAPRVTRPEDRPALACGVVRYLDAATTTTPRDGWSDALLDAGSHPHPARPAPRPGTVRYGGDVDLFWSLSFATTAADWRRVGGFDEGYVGYGGEDTDVGRRLEAADGDVLWLGGATAYHQFHGDGGLPVQHLEDIVRNGARFAARWGTWPMRGWLDAFEDLGLVRDDGAGGYVLARRPEHAR